MEAVIEQALLEKIQRLEVHVKRLEADLQLARDGSLETMIGQLRLREVVLLYVGEKGIQEFADQLSRELGSEMTRLATRHLFALNHAPLEQEQRETFRAIFNHGMNRW